MVLVDSFSISKGFTENVECGEKDTCSVDEGNISEEWKVDKWEKELLNGSCSCTSSTIFGDCASLSLASAEYAEIVSKGPGV